MNENALPECYSDRDIHPAVHSKSFRKWAFSTARLLATALSSFSLATWSLFRSSSEYRRKSERNTGQNRVIFVKKRLVSSPDDLFNENLGLAEMIALEYSNIPGAIPDDAVSEAHQALFRASRGFDSRKGEFTPYAARAVRNSLNSLYAKNLRIAQIFPKSLDDPPDWAESSGLGSAGTAFIGKFADSAQNVIREIKTRETVSVLEEILNSLAPRERIVVEGLRSGRSLSEIGEEMGVSKQAVHKISVPALQKLRKKLDLLGYRGVDSLGLLKTSLKNPARKAG